MSPETESARKKARIIRWRGVMGDSRRVLRLMVFVVLAVTGVALTFTQLGFVDVPLEDGSDGYVVTLLQVVALGALLLGTFAGMVLGLLTGAVLLLHAQLLPLDHYELSFITPITSVVMFGFVGLLLGVLLAVALRKNPSQIRRVIYIFIVCLVASFLYSLGFYFNVGISVVIHIVDTLGLEANDPAVLKIANSTATQLGSIETQVWGTALVMTLLCSVGDRLARKVVMHRGTLGLRTVFGAWLSVVVALSFMVMAAVSFGVSSADALHDAEDDMRNEVNYLCTQMKLGGKRVELLQETLSQAGVETSDIDEATLTGLSDLLADDVVLSGFTPNSDDIVIIEFDGRVYASNDERFTVGMDMSQTFFGDSSSAIERSKENQQIERFIFVDPARKPDAENRSLTAPDAPEVHPHIAYVYAQHSYDFAIDTEEASDEGVISADVVMIRSSDQVFAKRPEVMTWMTASSLVLLLAVFVIVFQLLNRVVAKRIDDENAALSLITSGNLDARAEAGGTREFESLTEGINDTVDALRGWIAEAESRMDAELATARAIQESALPSTFPPYPDIPKFDIFASMNAAKQVGGDFYDFFLIGEDCDDSQGKLGFVIADVSGKGVPAALFMMRAKALLRDYLASGMEIGEAVSEANRLLIEGNDEGMFVTAWVGVLDYGTGHVDYVNAGHNPPLLWQREGGWQWLRRKSGPVLGLFEISYRALEVDCLAGDTFLLYTDGVTEAFDVDEQLYGEDRLMAVAENGYRMHPRELLESVRSDVAKHANGAEQSDDITIMTLEVGVPPEVTATLEVPAEVSQLTTVNEFLHSELDRRLCPQRVQNQLDIAVEELFVNVCHYAYPEATPDEPGAVRIQRTYCADPPSITVDIIDEGIPYNPLEKPDAVTPGNIKDVPIGGLGILMAKRCTDEMFYERVNGSNVVTIVKKW